MTLPISMRGATRAHAGSRGAAETSRRRLPEAVETAFREVADALASVRQTAAAEADQQARAQAARNVLRLAGLRYEAGYSAYLEVLDAQRVANEAELALVRNRQSRLAASVDLMKALGGGCPWTRRASARGAARGWRQMTRQIVLDTETTGLNAKLGDRVIEIAASSCSTAAPPHHFHHYLNPSAPAKRAR